jgi:hypothetical protein
MAPRLNYTIPQKLSLLRSCARLQQEENHSFRSAVRELGLDPAQVRRWKQQSSLFEDFLLNYEKRKVNRAAKTLHSGRKSCLADIEEELLKFIFENRERGMSVSIRIVIMKAGQLDPPFRHKTDRAKDQAIRRFVASHGLVHRVHTHESQKSAQESATEATDWMGIIRPLVAGGHRHQDFVINMDQSPIFFSMVPRTTLNTAGARTVNVKTSTNATMRVTVSITVTASGVCLTPMMIFKGQPRGRIVRTFPTYPAGACYEVQEKAWMDQVVMLSWVDRVLKPYVQTAPVGIHPILILDSYRCHMMASVVDAIAALGVQVEHIPGGCTGLCQPIDVGICKPLKNHVRNKHEDWMMHQQELLRQQGQDNQKIGAPSRETVSSWVIDSLQALGEETIKNTWRHNPYSYYENDVADQLADLGVQAANLSLEESLSLDGSGSDDESEG